MYSKKNLTTAHLVIRKLAAKADRKELISVLIHHTRGSNSASEVINRLLECLLSLYEEINKEPRRNTFTWSEIIELFQEAACHCGIPPDQFYPLIVERFLRLYLLNQSRASYVADARERILNAALEVFSERGFHQATVDEIAQQAGVGKGTLYRHFGNKEKLFNEMVNFQLRKLEAKAENVLNSSDDVLTLISKYMRVYFEFFDQNQKFYRVVAREQLDFGERIRDLYIEKIMRRVPLLKKKIVEDRNVLKQVNFQTVFYGVMGFMHGVIQRWLTHDCSYPLMDELPVVEQVLFYGFVHPKDRDYRERKEVVNGKK